MRMHEGAGDRAVLWLAGVGKALATEFLKAGDSVVICSRSGVPLSQNMLTVLLSSVLAPNSKRRQAMWPHICLCRR